MCAMRRRARAGCGNVKGPRCETSEVPATLLSSMALLLPSPPATLWPPAAERRLEAAVLMHDLSPAASLWWESSLASCWLAAKV